MHIQPEILSAAGVPGQLLDHGAIVETNILSPGVVGKNSGNWNGAVLIRSLILPAAL